MGAQVLVFERVAMRGEDVAPDGRMAAAALLERFGPTAQHNLGRLMAPAPDAVPGARRALHVRSSADPALQHLRRDVFAGPALEDASDLPIQILVLNNALITPRGFVVHDDSLIWNTTYINHAWQSGVGSSAIPDVFNTNGLWGYDPIRREIALVEPAEVVDIDRTCFLFNSENATGNFAHFMFDTMLQVPTYREAALREPMAPLFSGGGFRQEAARRLLGWTLGRPERDWLFVEQNFVRVRRLVVALPHVDFAAGRISRRAAGRMRAAIGTALGPIPDREARDIYVSRDDASGLRTEARMANAPAFRRLMAELGVVEVRASDLAGPAYFETFKNARTIIGLHGAGLMNVLLARDGRMIELASPGIGGPLLAFVAEAAGVPTARLMHPGAHGPDVEIDLDAVREALRRFAREAEAASPATSW